MKIILKLWLGVMMVVLMGSCASFQNTIVDTHPMTNATIKELSGEYNITAIQDTLIAGDADFDNDIKK